jgi:hypothetical protein
MVQEPGNLSDSRTLALEQWEGLISRYSGDNRSGSCSISGRPHSRGGSSTGCAGVRAAARSRPDTEQLVIQMAFTRSGTTLSVEVPVQFNRPGSPSPLARAPCRAAAALRQDAGENR